MLMILLEILTQVYRFFSGLSACSRNSNDHERDSRNQAFLERVAMACGIGHAFKKC